MKKIILILASMLFALMGKAQTINGRITDTENNPVELATVILQTMDSVFIDAVYSDSTGYFTFVNDIQNYRLLVQHLLYEPYENMYSSGNVGTISLDNKDYHLSEVVVKGERPVVRVIDGRMTYDMPQLLQGKVVSTAYESLLQLPGVSEVSGLLKLAGASSLSVIINGKPTTMSSEQLIELLKNMPKERIQKAEVMYSAPPQYHIRGAAINLVLTGGTPESANFQGQVNGGYSQYHYADYNTGVTLLYNAPKFSTDFMYSFGYVGNRTGLDLKSNHLYKGDIYEIEQNNINTIRKSVHNIRLGNDFYINDKSKLSLTYTGQIVPWIDAESFSKGTYSDSQNEKSNDIPTQMHNFALNYTAGSGLSLGADYTLYRDHTTQHYEEYMTGKEDVFNAKSKQDINRLSLYVDQSHGLENDWTFNYGAKFMYASNESSQEYTSLTGKDMSGSNSSSKLDEFTYNLYAGFEKSFSEKLSVTASLTGEYYKYGSFNEWSLFPAAELTYIVDPSHIFQLSISSDKTYPGYWEMMNSITYLNGYAEIHGNPDLRPYKDYSFQLNYILKNKYILTAYSNYMDDYFVQLPYQSSEKLALIYKTTNFDYSSTAGLNAVIPFAIGSVMDSRFTLNGYYQREKSSHFHDTSFDNDNFAFYTGLDNTFNISSNPNIKAQLSGAYASSSIQGPSKLSDLYRVDAGLKWTSSDGNAELKLKANDIFNSWSPDCWSMNFNNQDLKMHIIPDSRSISLSFSYKFGDYKEKKRENVDTSRFGK